MNILFNISPAVRPVTGIGTYAKELIRHLLRIDQDNHYMLFSIKSPFPGRRLPFSPPKAENVSYRSIVVPYRWLNLLWNNFRLFPIDNFVKEIDVLHSLDKVAPFTKKAKVVVTIHDMSWYIFGSRSERRGLVYRQVVETIKRSSAIITNSEFSKDEIIKYLPFAREKMHIINLGVSDRFHPIDKREIPEDIHKRYPWDGYILYIGMLDEPRKNVESIVKAYAILKKRRRIERKLVLCGAISKYGYNLLRLIREIDLPKDIIIYSHWIPDDDIPYIYNKAHLMIFPSFYEGFGLPVLESMACARPIIVSDIPPLREVANDAALFVDPKDHKELADSIEMLLFDDELYNAVVERGLKRSKEFTWIKTAQQTLKLYEGYQAI